MKAKVITCNGSLSSNYYALSIDGKVFRLSESQYHSIMVEKGMINKEGYALGNHCVTEMKNYFQAIADKINGN